MRIDQIRKVMRAVQPVLLLVASAGAFQVPAAPRAAAVPARSAAPVAGMFDFMAPKEADEPEKPKSPAPAAKALMPQTDRPESPMQTKRGGARGGTADNEPTLAERLDKVERLLVPLLAKLEGFSKGGMPGMSDRLKKRG